MLFRSENLIDREGAFGSYFGASFLSGIAIMVGLVLLIVPGVYLMGRWSLASAMVIAKGMRATDALRASWQATQDCVWKVAGLYVLCIAMFFAILLVLGGSAGFLAVSMGGAADEVETAWPFVIVLNLAVNLGVVASAYLSVALFDQLVGQDRTVEGIFA